MVRWEGVDVVRLCSNVWFVVIVCLYVLVFVCMCVFGGDGARIIRTCSANGGVVHPTLPPGVGGCLCVCLFVSVKSFGKNRNESKS